MNTAHTPQQPPDWREICDQTDYHHNPHEQTWSQIRQRTGRINYTVLFAVGLLLVYALGWFLQHVS